MTEQKHCAFLAHRSCYVEVDEIPLEVCQLCVEAWRVDKEINILSQRQLGVPATSVEAPPRETPQRTQSSARKKLQTQLSELDRQFSEDAIEPQEYIAQRNALISALSGVSPQAIHVAAESEEPDKASEASVLILEKPAFGQVRVKGSPSILPATVAQKTLEAVYNLGRTVDASNRVQLTVDGVKIAILGSNKNQVALMLLSNGDSFENHAEDLNRIAETLQESEDWEFATVNEKKPEKALSSVQP